jgi:hypothetical protein
VAVGLGRVDGQDAAVGARPHRNGAPAWRGGAGASGITKGKRGEDDDDYVIPTSPWVPAVRGMTRSRLVARRGRGLTSYTRVGRRWWAGLVGCAHIGVFRFSYLSFLLYIIQI